MHLQHTAPVKIYLVSDAAVALAGDKEELLKTTIFIIIFPRLRNVIYGQHKPRHFLGLVMPELRHRFMIWGKMGHGFQEAGLVVPPPEK